MHTEPLAGLCNRWDIPEVSVHVWDFFGLLRAALIYPALKNQ